eukprot:6194648-Pleurochrysis_carterae.AAC.3
MDIAKELMRLAKDCGAAYAKFQANLLPEQTARFCVFLLTVPDRHSHLSATLLTECKRCPKELLTEEQYNKPHPVPTNAYGATYGAHREFLEFSVEQHRELWEYGKEIGIEWATSTWDVTSAREMITIPCDFLKAPRRAAPPPPRKSTRTCVPPLDNCTCAGKWEGTRAAVEAARATRGRAG